MSLPSYRRIINCTYSMLGAWLTQHLPAEERHGAVITADHEYLASGEAHVYVGSRKFFRQQNWFNLVDLWRSLAPAVPPPPGARPYAARAAELPCTLPAGRKVALNPGSGSDRRRWPPASFAWLGEALANRGFAPILLGAPPERELCAEVQMQCRIPLPNFAGQTSPAQAVHLLSQVDLLVSVDTGAVHLAAAAGTPVLGLYGVGAYFRETAPWSAGNTVLQAPLGTEIARLPPPLVLAAALHRLGAIPEASLRQELAEANFEGWETMFLPAQADPLGGLTYRPLHRHRLRLEELWTRALRHALAESFCEGQQALSMAYLRGLELEVNLSSERRELHERIAHVQAALARMAEEAALCKRLASAPDRHAADQIRGLTNSLMQTLEQLKQAVRADPLPESSHPAPGFQVHHDAPHRTRSHLRLSRSGVPPRLRPARAHRGVAEYLSRIRARSSAVPQARRRSACASRPEDERLPASRGRDPRSSLAGSTEDPRSIIKGATPTAIALRSARAIR